MLAGQKCRILHLAVITVHNFFINRNFLTRITITVSFLCLNIHLVESSPNRARRLRSFSCKTRLRLGTLLFIILPALDGQHASRPRARRRPRPPRAPPVVQRRRGERRSSRPFPISISAAVAVAVSFSFSISVAVSVSFSISVAVAFSFWAVAAAAAISAEPAAVAPRVERAGGG